MPNTLATTTLVCNEVGDGFLNDLTLAAQFDMEYSDYFNDPSGPGGKVGDTVKYRKPFRGQATSGSAYQPQNIIDQTVNISLTNYFGYHLGWSSTQGTLELAYVKDRYIDPATAILANAADVFAGNAIYRDIWNTTGTIGTTPATAQVFADARVKLADGATAQEGLAMVLDLMADSRLASSTATFFTPQAKFDANWTKNQFASGQLGIQKWFRSANVPRHTTGAVSTASSATVNGAGQTGSSIITQAWGTSALKRGDRVNFAGVRGWNPQSNIDTGRLQDFVLTADAVDAGGAITLSISPSIITSGPLQTVNASPANGAAVTFWSMAVAGTFAAQISPQSLLLAPGAAVFVMADLNKPNGGAVSRFIRAKGWPISIRYSEQWDGKADINMTRLDFLCGAALTQGEKAARVVG